MSLFGELKRRNVFKVAVAYVVVGWVVLQVADTIAPLMNLPDMLSKYILFFLIVGFPITLFFSWVYELTPEGLKKQNDVDRSASTSPQTGQKINFIIIGALVLAISGLVFDRMTMVSPSPTQESAKDSQIKEPSLPPSIAVLAFEDFSPNKDQEYFADGISDEILNLLAKTKAMRVTGRTSSFSFKGSKDDIPTIADKLNVAHVLEGSISKSGNKLKITAQLNDAEGLHIWSETYKRELTDVFEIQEEIASAILQKLKVSLLGDATIKNSKRAVDINLYNQYLLARALHYKRERAATTRAREILASVTAEDPTFGDAQALLARVMLASNRWDFGDFSWNKAIRLAQVPIKLALEFNPDSAEVQALNCYMLSNEERLNEAEKACNKALAINPSHPEARISRAFILSKLLRHKEKLQLQRESVVSDPISLPMNIDLAGSYLDYNDINNAMKIISRIEDINPRSPQLIQLKVQLLLRQGRPAEALHYGMQNLSLLEVPDRRTNTMAKLAVSMGLEKLARYLFVPPGEALVDAKNGNVEKGLNLIKQTLSDDDENGMGLIMLTVFQAASGYQKAAIETYQFMLEKFDVELTSANRCSSIVSLAMVYKDSGDIETATSLVNPCRDRLTQDIATGYSHYKIHDLKLSLYFYDKEYDNAFKEYEEQFNTELYQHWAMESWSYLNPIEFWAHLFPIENLESFKHFKQRQDTYWAKQRQIFDKLQIETEDSK